MFPFNSVMLASMLFWIVFHDRPQRWEWDEGQKRKDWWRWEGGGCRERRWDRAARDQCSSPSSVSASPLIYGNVWSRWSIIVWWTLTIKISQVLVAGGARGRPGSNHYGFTPLMMGRELIYPGEKQIKALLSPALRHTIAYINILSWAIQVSKGLVHLHFHKGPLSTLWPTLPSRLSSWWVPAVLSFTSLSSSFHFPPRSLHLLAGSFSVMNVIIPLVPSSSWTPAVSCLHFSSTSASF